MTTGAARHLEDERPRLDREKTARALSELFAWRQNRFSCLLVRVLSRFLYPLEEGTYVGRVLPGHPHRSSRIETTPMTVFIVPEGRRQKLYLAARLRMRGPINLIQDPGADAKMTSFREPGRMRRRRRGPSDEAREYNDLSGGLVRMEALLAVQHAADESITVVPVTRSFHQHHPESPPTTWPARFYWYTPMHVIRRIASLARTFHTAGVKNCTPVDLAAWVESNPRNDLRSQAVALRREVISNIESEHRATTGPPLAPRWEVKKLVLSDPVLSEYIRKRAMQLGVNTEVVFREAQEYIGEIASNVRVGVLRYFGALITRGFDKLLKGFEVDREGIQLLTQCDSRSRVVLVCCHKSYMDPLMIAYGICRSGLMAPQQAAGINLNIWPLGWVLRHCGAFYLRRTFVGESLYKEVFSAYVRHLLAENFITAFYIEGTRSRDGKLQKPKTGYLAILEEAMQLGVCDDITLVPVYLGYDRVPEEDGHVREMEGGQKIAETMKLFSRIYKSVTTTLGRAYIKFGPTMNFRALVEEHGLDGAAGIVCDRINDITVVTARSLASCALLSCGGTWVSVNEFDTAAGQILKVCARMAPPMAGDADRRGVRSAVDWLALEDRVAPEEREGAAGFRVEGDGRRFLEYNKNILLAHLLRPALAAVAERASGRVPVEQSITFLKRLFAEEFVFGPGEPEADIRPALEAGADVLAALLDSFLEGYLVACKTLDSMADGPPVADAEMVRRCFDAGIEMLDEGVIGREESLSRILFGNALKNFRKMDILARPEPDESGKEERALVPGELFSERADILESIESLLGGP